MSGSGHAKRRNEFVVHCLMCGKNFRVGDKAVCGGTMNGKSICSTKDLQRELDNRLPKEK